MPVSRRPPIAGKIALYTPSNGRTVRLAVKNDGRDPLGVTSNYFPTLQEMRRDQNSHDDLRYGHGMECQPGTWSWQEFPIGGPYNQYKIKTGGVFRVGLRNACWGVARVPEPGERPTLLDLSNRGDFKWYGGASPQNSRPHVGQIEGMKGWHTRTMHRNTGKDRFISDLAKVMKRPAAGVELEGRALLTAHKDRNKKLTHWTVRFENRGDTPFIGTVVFQEAKKNDGIGLESMGVPNRGSAAEQRIEANGNYGVVAKAGRALRLGIRGYGYFETQLPDDGQIEVPARFFRRESSQANAAFFDKREVLKKRREKLDKVRFFEGGKAINGAIEPIVYRGREADARAPFRAPRLVVRSVEDSAKTPGGGWIVEVESHLPNRDKAGALGFVAAIEIRRRGEGTLLTEKKFFEDRKKNTWFIERDSWRSGQWFQSGDLVSVTARGLGWSAEVRLPGSKRIIDSDQDPKLWGWRPDQYRRESLDKRALKTRRRGV